MSNVAAEERREKPRRFGIGVRCCKKQPKNLYYGTIHSGVGKGMWKVQWDDGSETETKSASMRIAEYGESVDPNEVGHLISPTGDDGDQVAIGEVVTGEPYSHFDTMLNDVSDVSDFDDSDDEDFIPQNNQRTQNTIEWSEYLNKFIGKKVTVDDNTWDVVGSSEGDVLKWTGEGGGVVDKSKWTDDIKQGMNPKISDDGDSTSKKSSANLLDSFLKFYPGNIKKHVEKVNAKIRSDCHHSLISEHEWMTFWGLILAATNFVARGANLWATTKPDGSCSGIPEFFREMMPLDRFQVIKKRCLYAFAGEDEDDPWNPIRGLINDFNKNRLDSLLASCIVVLDESMSPFCPQTTKNGIGLGMEIPHLSFVPRKPKPLGHELKNSACSHTCIMMHIELQEGAKLMATKKYVRRLGKAPAKVMRMVTGALGIDEPDTDDSDKSSKVHKNRKHVKVILGDADFGSIRAAVAVKKETGREVIFVIKNQATGFPKKWLLARLKYAPAGMSLVLTCTIDGVELVAVGYKYNYSKVLFFLMTKDAGSTLRGTPYEQKFTDSNGCQAKRLIPRMIALSRYFKYCDRIDVHNHARQHCLALEEKWVTQDAYFRFVTTIFGICVVDSFNATRHSVRKKHRYKTLTNKQLADILAWEMCDVDETRFETTRPCPPGQRRKRMWKRKLSQEFLEKHGHSLKKKSCRPARNPAEPTIDFNTKLHLLFEKHALRNCGRVQCAWCANAYGIFNRVRSKCSHCNMGVHGVIPSGQNKLGCYELHLKYGVPQRNAWKSDFKNGESVIGNNRWSKDPTFLQGKNELLKYGQIPGGIYPGRKRRPVAHNMCLI